MQEFIITFRETFEADLKECNELVSIFATSVKTAEKNKITNKTNKK